MTDKLLNIGPKSYAWLKAIGIRTGEDLRQLGAVNTFVKVRKAGFKASLNLLYALAGAERNVHWTALTAEEKNALVQDATAQEAALKNAKRMIMPARDVTPERDSGGEAESFLPEPALFDDPSGGGDSPGAEPAAE